MFAFFNASTNCGVIWNGRSSLYGFFRQIRGKQSRTIGRIKITNDEIEEVESRITGILHLIDQMQSVDTDSIEPMSHPFDGTQILRSDTITEENNRDELQKSPLKSKMGYF